MSLVSLRDHFGGVVAAAIPALEGLSTITLSCTSEFPPKLLDLLNKLLAKSLLSYEEGVKAKERLLKWLAEGHKLTLVEAEEIFIILLKFIKEVSYASYIHIYQ